MKNWIEYRLPKKRQPIFSVFKGVSRIFMRKRRIVSLADLPEGRCLYVANHANKMGPFVYDVFFPCYHVKWGAYQMLGDYASRRAYLRDVLYVQKNGMGRKKAAFKAFFEAFFSGMIYRGLKILPTYPDGRLVRTVKNSAEILRADIPLMIYPENSNVGYAEFADEYFSGFVMVLDRYRKLYGEDVPVCPVYYSKAKKIIVTGEPCTLSEVSEGGADRAAVADELRKRVNALGARVKEGEFDRK